jgi:hypothetical protein
MSKYHVNIDNLNLRKGAGTDFDVIAQLGENTTVEKLESSENGYWFRVKTTQNGDDLEGWVAGELLESDEKIGWVDRIGDFPVERKPIPRIGNKPFLVIGHPMIRRFAHYRE